MDHDTGVLWLDRELFTATRYPTDYGFVPKTLAEDGDPLDVLVLVDEPTFPGCHINVRPLGLFWMQDEAGPDAKVLTLPTTDPRREGVDNIDRAAARSITDAANSIGQGHGQAGWPLAIALERVRGSQDLVPVGEEVHRRENEGGRITRQALQQLLDANDHSALDVIRCKD